MGDKNKGSAPAKNATKDNAATGNAAADEPRKRAAISPAKALAITVAGLVGILNSKPVAAVLTPEQKAQVKTASEAADELNAKTIKPITDRIAAIQTEFQDVSKAIGEAKDPAAMTKAADQAKALSQELGRLQNRLQNLTKTASA